MVALSRHTPLTLTADEVQRLRSLNDPVDLREVRRIYLSLSRSSPPMWRRRRSLPAATRFAEHVNERRRPSSSVSPARSPSASRRRHASLRSFLARWPSSRRSTSSPPTAFFIRMRFLQRENLMDRKGFPESYDIGGCSDSSRRSSGPAERQGSYLFAPDL